MTIYIAYVSDKEANTNHNVKLAVLDTEKDQQLFENKDCDALFTGTGLTDNDIFFYVYKEDIPEANHGVIKPGDVYDYLTILQCRKEDNNMFEQNGTIPAEEENLAKWVEDNLDKLDLFYDYLVATTDGSVVRIAEGSGDNLDAEDRENGCVDYIDYSIYHTVQQIQDDAEEEGGMVMLKTYFSELSTEEIVKETMDMAELSAKHIISGRKAA